MLPFLLALTTVSQSLNSIGTHTFAAPSYEWTCSVGEIADVNLSFVTRHEADDLSSWFGHDKIRSKIAVIVNLSLLDKLDSFKKLYVRIVAADAGSHSNSPCDCTDRRVKLEL